MKPHPAVGLLGLLLSCAPSTGMFTNVSHNMARAPPARISCSEESVPKVGDRAECFYSEEALVQRRGKPLKIFFQSLADSAHHKYVTKQYAWTEPDTVPEVIVYFPSCAGVVGHQPLAITDGWLGRIYTLSDHPDSVGILNGYHIIRDDNAPLPVSHPGCKGKALLRSPQPTSPPVKSEPDSASLHYRPLG